MRNPKLRLLIVEPHPDYLMYLQELLKARLGPKTEIVTAANLTAAWNTIPQFKPEIVVMAGSLYGLCGADLTRMIHKTFPAIDIVLMVDELDPKFRHCGAWHVILKTEASSKLVSLLKSHNWGHAIGRRMRTIFRPVKSIG